MGPKELLKSSSPSFDRSGEWVVSWGSLRPPASPSASAKHRMVGVPAKALRRSSQ